MSADAAIATIRQAPDHGPWYAETDLGRFPAEPVNTVSNLVFLVVLILGLRRIFRGQIRSRFFYTAYTLLAVGWIGGTIYHATRGSVIWAVMDFAPIAMLCGLTSLWLVHRLPANWRRGYLFFILPLLGVAWAGAEQLDSVPLRIGAVYAILAALIIAPAAIHCGVTRSAGRAGLLAGSVAAFAVALVFRTYDAELITTTPKTGTHFLWHLFGGLATFLIFEFVQRIHFSEKQPAEKIQAEAVPANVVRPDLA
jgi:Ceramidase